MQIVTIAAEPYVFITMPVGALADAGIRPDDIIEIFVEDDKVILQKAQFGENIVCDEDCDHCPLRLLDCENDGERSPGKENES